MKKLSVVFTLILTVALAFTSCKKEERESMFTLNNIDHETDHGYLLNAGSSSTQSYYFIYLLSPELDFDSSFDFIGYGDTFALIVLSDDPDELLSGEYSFSSGSIYDGVVILGYDEDLDEAVQYDLDSGGTTSAKITVSGTTYEIEYSMEVETGATVTGYYKGTLEEGDVPVKKSFVSPFSK